MKIMSTSTEKQKGLLTHQLKVKQGTTLILQQQINGSAPFIAMQKSEW